MDSSRSCNWISKADMSAKFLRTIIRALNLTRPELKGGVSIVRELHVYGSVVPVSARDPTKFQHQGFGMLLMEEAERIAKEEHGSVKISVISGTNNSV